MKIFCLDKKIAIYYIIAIFFITLDRFLKTLALTLPDKLEFLNGWINFNFVKNFNIAFSLPITGVGLNIFVFILIVFLIYFLIFLCGQKYYFRMFLVLNVILGAASNLYDRLKFGFVVDYIDLKYFAVFNVADTMISISVVILGVIILINDKNKIN